jgi:16S rRNA (guanine527-N7)-methyltransferase
MTRYVKILKELEIETSVSTQLDAFETLFLRWNSSINLSAARTADEVAEHIIDSLHVVPRIGTEARVLDVGAGGGFPSVMVAICCPDATVTALEPVHKKHAFLRTAARELKLANFEAFARRIEDHEEADYDVAMSRATFDLREWIERALTRVRVGGHAIGFEGVERSDLPSPLTRYSYDLAGKQRAIISVERTG